MAQVSAEERARLADIREWAEANGMKMWSQGRIPPGTLAAYEAAHPGRVVDDAPDWDRAGRELAETGDPLAGVEVEPEPEGPPPPVSLDEARERAGAGRKRKPPKWAGGGGAKPQQAAPVRVTAGVRADIEGKLALLLSVPVGAWEVADPYCGGAMAKAAPETVRALTPIICQSPGAVEFFTKGTTFMLYLALAKALQPVAQAVYRHHLSPEAQRERQREAARGGQVERREEPQQDLSAYTTVVTGHIPEPRPA